MEFLLRWTNLNQRETIQGPKNLGGTGLINISCTLNAGRILGRINNQIDHDLVCDTREGPVTVNLVLDNSLSLKLKRNGKKSFIMHLISSGP